MLGNIEVYGHSPGLGGIVVFGWIDLSWDEPLVLPPVSVVFESGIIVAPAVLCLHPREDVRKLGRGFLLVVQSSDALAEPPVSLTLGSGDRAITIMPSSPPQHYDEVRLFQHAQHFAKLATPNESRARLRKLLDRPPYTGQDTLGALPWPVHFDVDKLYFCPPDGVLIRGWFLDPIGEVARLRVCGTTMRDVDPASWVSIKRPDVVAAFTKSYGLASDRCGMLTYAPGVYRPGTPLYIQVEMRDGSIGFRPLTPSLYSGLPAIKEVLSSFELRRDALVQGYDTVVGPAVAAMNSFRLQQKPDVAVMHFGAEPAAPRCSIIVPLYGRVDFLEYQLAFFAETLASDHELIYVLDDPERRAETERLAASSFARFQRPFTLLGLGHNVGFAPANNIGLRHAHGETICFLNSDVFPRNPDWLECMIETLEIVPDTGLVGALLTYEDGTLQHDGCTFERLPEFGNWPFPMHPGKGQHFKVEAERAKAPVVTGACMVMRRDLALELDGLDEGYVIGDFEDADLCLRLAERGLGCVVDNRAVLFHLERQSQNLQAQSWRMNLTLYNAWRFQERWRDRGF